MAKDPTETIKEMFVELKNDYFDDKIQLRKRYCKLSHVHAPLLPTAHPPFLPLPSPPSVNNYSTNRLGPPIRRISNEQMNLRRARGLFYYCDEKWHKGHKCKTDKVFYLQVPLNEEETSDDPLPPPVITDKLNFAEISMHSLQGTIGYHSMKVLDKVNGIPFLILIDSSSTYSFVTPALAQKVGCHMQAPPIKNILVVSGESLAITGAISSAKIDIQGLSWYMPVMVLQLGGYDMVLGLDWLYSLGKIRWDFK